MSTLVRERVLQSWILSTAL